MPWIQSYDPMQGPIAGQWMNTDTGEIFYGNRPPQENQDPVAHAQRILDELAQVAPGLAGLSGQTFIDQNPEWTRLLSKPDAYTGQFESAGDAGATGTEGVTGATPYELPFLRALQGQITPEQQAAYKAQMDYAQQLYDINTARNKTTSGWSGFSKVGLPMIAMGLGPVIGAQVMSALNPAAAGWTSGYDLPMGDSFFGDFIGGIADDVGQTVSGGWTDALQFDPSVIGSEWGSTSPGLQFDPSVVGSEWGLPGVDISTGQIPSWAADVIKATSPSLLGTIGNAGKSLLGSILGGETNGGGLGNLFGGLNADSLLKTGFSAAPFLGAIAYAQNQDPFDTSQLQSLYNQYNPQAQANQYDLNTGIGRNQLTSNLARRGVLGSSFGNMDIANYDTSRELGRQSLINQGVGVSGGLASTILDAQIKQQQQKNDLYGRALYGLGGAIGGMR